MALVGDVSGNVQRDVEEVKKEGMEGGKKAEEAKRGGGYEGRTAEAELRGRGVE